MTLTKAQIRDAFAGLTELGKVPLGGRTAYRIAKARAALIPIWEATEAVRTSLIETHKEALAKGDLTAFGAEWNPLMAEPEEVAVSPLQITEEEFAGCKAVSANVLIALGPLLDMSEPSNIVPLPKP